MNLPNIAKKNSFMIPIRNPVLINSKRIEGSSERSHDSNELFHRIDRYIQTKNPNVPREPINWANSLRKGPQERSILTNN